MWLSCAGKVYVLILYMNIIVTIITIVRTFLGSVSLDKTSNSERLFDVWMVCDSLDD